ncbi:MAG: EF-hand domain-containing protein, partial [Candidatus Hydrogenedentes bacterium]|nr:EF-hand domain-containing protein [Candidatus Hydrogenedentota bacterium]
DICEPVEGEGEVVMGSLQVILGPAAAVAAGARWRREGAVEWRETETAENNLEPGTYRIEFKDISGWTSPAVQTALLRSDEETTVIAVYESGSSCVGDPILVSMTDRNANPGDELLIPINVSSAEAISPAGIQIEVRYDPAFLDAASVEVRPTAITGKMGLVPNTTEPGKIIITVMGTMGGQGLKGRGHFFDIYAKIRDDVIVGTSSEITLDTVTFYNSEVERLCIDLEPTAILTAGGDYLLGDLNGDGISDVGDALWALRLAVGLETVQSGHVIAGDLNGDNRVNCADSVLLQRLAAGFDQVSPVPMEGDVSDALLLANILGSGISIEVRVDDESGRVNETFELPVRVDNAQGLSGYDITLSFDSAVLEVDSVREGTVTGSYPQEWQVSDGLLHISMGRKEAVYDSEKGILNATLAVVTFRVLAMPEDAATTMVRLDGNPELKGQYGDSFEWFTRVNKVHGEILIGSATDDEGEAETLEQMIELLIAQFNEIDTNGDGVLSYDEVAAAVPGMTQAQFNEIDTNADGSLSLDELETFLDKGCGCFSSCRKGLGPVDTMKRMIGDWLLIGLALMVMVGWSTIGHSQKK